MERPGEPTNESAYEALLVNTINGAYNSHEEAIKGSIAPGKLEDFVALADDPHTGEPGENQRYRDRAHRHRRLDGLRKVAVCYFAKTLRGPAV
jgi:hypothetical protein